MTTPLKPLYTPTLDEAVRFAKSNPLTAWEVALEANSIGVGMPPVSGGRFRELWKACGGAVDKKGRAWVEMDVLPTLLYRIVDAVKKIEKIES